jgi:hypothetical protein
MSISIITRVLDYKSIKIPHDIDEEEEDKRISKKTHIRNEIINMVKVGLYGCSCGYNNNNLNDYIDHCIKCNELKTTNDTIIDMLNEMNVMRYVPSNLPQCKYCLKTFNDSRSKGKEGLHQHLNRGKKYSCVKGALKKEIDTLSNEDLLIILNKVRSLKGK